MYGRVAQGSSSDGLPLCFAIVSQPVHSARVLSAHQVANDVRVAEAAVEVDLLLDPQHGGLVLAGAGARPHVAQI